MQHQVTISVEGVLLDVDFHYTPAEPKSWAAPGYSEEFELAAVTAGNADVLPLLSSDMIDIIISSIKRMRQ